MIKSSQNREFIQGVRAFLIKNKEMRGVNFVEVLRKVKDY